MSAEVFEGGFEQLEERPHLELVVNNAGPLATGEVVESPTYKYEVMYAEDGTISGARSWSTDPAAAESNFKMFDAQGRPTYTSESTKDGDLRESIWYKNGEPTSRVVVDKIANTHTMTIHQPGIGDWVHTTPYAGPEGWTS